MRGQVEADEKQTRSPSRRKHLWNVYGTAGVMVRATDLWE